MASFPLFAEFDSLSRAGWLLAVAVVFLLMVCLGIFALALYGLWRTRSQNSLESEGTPQIEEAVGKHATVYIPIPGDQSSAGKIQMNLQNRTVEYLAMTSGEKLPSGSKVLVVRVITPTTVEVQPVLDAERSDDV